jgi:predicted Zn-dependent peptidase
MKHFITLEDINTAAKKYLSEENLQQFIFIPESYDEAKGEID